MHQGNRLDISVIVNAYNQANILRKTLWSYCGQSYRSFRIVIADDGSSDNTLDVINWFKNNTWLNIEHVWHRDSGFRRTVILNKAVAECGGEYLVFTDADCIAHKHFVRNHVKLASRGGVVSGRTVRLSKKLSDRISVDDIKDGKAQSLTFDKIVDGLFGDTKKVEFGIYIPWSVLWPIVQVIKRKKYIWGGNFSCWRDDFLYVNGFNEDITGWGKEDVDLNIRFLNYGLKLISGCNICINYHLWHKKTHRVREVFEKNMKIAETYKETGHCICQNGISKYL